MVIKFNYWIRSDFSKKYLLGWGLNPQKWLLFCSAISKDASLLYWIYFICMSRSLLITQCRFLQSLLYHSLCSFRNVIAHRICWVGTATLAAMASQPPRGGCSGGSDVDGEGSGADSDGADSGGAVSRWALDHFWHPDSVCTRMT